MSYPINYPTPQGANVQIFQEGGTTSDWVKPQGASFVWFTLIGGGGGGGNGSTGAEGLSGGSASVTNFMCPAFLIPDVLRVQVGAGGPANAGVGGQTNIIYQQKNGTGYTLLSADPGSGNTGAGVTAANYFTAMGFYQSIAGINGDNIPSASTTTFLSGGAAGGGTVSAGNNVTANYGYVSSGGAGSAGGGSAGGGSFFITNPIIVSVGGAGGGGGGGVGGAGGIGGVGSGGGGGGRGNTTGGTGGRGGSGLVVIITW